MELVFFWDSVHFPFQTDLCVYMLVYNIGVTECMRLDFKTGTALLREKNRGCLLLTTTENLANKAYFVVPWSFKVQTLKFLNLCVWKGCL